MRKTKEVSTEESAVVLPEGLTTMSSKIRYLDSTGMPRGAIAKTLGIRYQWVRNVLITPVKKAK